MDDRERLLLSPLAVSRGRVSSGGREIRLPQHSDVATRIWNLCHVLRDDGIVYHKYLSELTYLLFLKNAKELGVERELPKGCRWDDLLAHKGTGMLGFYRKLLTQLGEDVLDPNIRDIFSFPTTVFSHDENLEKVVLGIEAIEWHSELKDGLGDIYESLLERNATEARAGSGQYFTPRALVDCMVRLVRPAEGELIQDPAVGTGGFLISAHRQLEGATRGKRRRGAHYQGIEIERDTYRLCLMNMFLHQMSGNVVHGDALTFDSRALAPADLILANPPFGVSGGGARLRRTDLPFPTANKQLMFLQHIYLSLKPGGRAAVVVPDNVLFEPGTGKRVRQDLMERCDLHTILRLPAGIFYAPGVKTNVLFFTRVEAGSTGTRSIWFFDMRTNVLPFSKRRPLVGADFDEFMSCYGTDPFGHSQRAEAAHGRFKEFSRQEIREQDDDLNIQWMSDNRSDEEVMDASELISAMSVQLRAANLQLEELADLMATTNAPLIDGGGE